MKVIILSETKQQFNGVIYYRSILNDKPYYTHQKHGNIHRSVWSYYNGYIPAGYHIHHIDENPANNDIDNLELLSASEHKLLHNGTDIAKVKTCKQCKASFIPIDTKYNEYCNYNCYQLSRYHSDKDKENRQCVICGTVFVCNKYRKQKTCSISCGTKLAWKNKKADER